MVENQFPSSNIYERDDDIRNDSDYDSNDSNREDHEDNDYPSSDSSENNEGGLYDHDMDYGDKKSNKMELDEEERAIQKYNRK